MIYNHISPDQVSIDFINGYLAPWALLMDYSTQEVGFSYYFRQLEKSGNLHESIVREIKARVRSEHQYPAFAESIAVLEIQKGLTEIAEWPNNLQKHLIPWNQRILDNLRTSFQQVWRDDFLVKDFTEVLKAFFQNQSVRCLKLEEAIKNGLYYDWGGIGFDDFFFEAEQSIFHLHFDLSD